jgi:ribokinase
MAILNIGSCCIDHVYHVSHFVAPGETLSCSQYEVHPGGKGLNQSIAIARAGVAVDHFGKIGRDGEWLKTELDKAGANTAHLIVTDEATGHANIQVDAEGENAIVLFGGTNRKITADELAQVLSHYQSGDFLLLQNETSELDTAIRLASDIGMRIIFNAAPMTGAVKQLPLNELDLLIINEIEGEGITGCNEPTEILDSLTTRYPDLNVLLTLGGEGAMFSGPSGNFSINAMSVTPVDTTGAGDTFTGYFVAAYSEGDNIDVALDLASRAAALSVTRAGAASSIPVRDEIGK